MWSLILITSLATSLNPIRIAVLLLMITRPRPLANAFVYWIGCLIIGLPALLIPLLVFNLTPALKPQANAAAAPGSSSTVQYIQFGVGALALTAALWIALRPLMRRRHHKPSTARHRAEAPVATGRRTAVSTLPMQTAAPALETEPWWRRLIARVRKIWQGESLWVALVMGLGTGPPADGMLIVITAILGAGVTLSVQLMAGAVYVFGTLMIVELMLLAYVVTPTRSEVAVRWFHDWTRAHSRPLFATIFGIVGLLMIAAGAGFIH